MCELSRNDTATTKWENVYSSGTNFPCEDILFAQNWYVAVAVYNYVMIEMHTDTHDVRTQGER